MFTLFTARYRRTGPGPTGIAADTRPDGRMRRNDRK
ncbi:hypothetical protein Rrhod_1966 [Rhodococcus rhodnii LMG 5362]|uniref:Uncharacterized protein n=1 Tax=Rhodococcus rhodnii LMG 5362 TaxID=1273125 RepID=R7WRV9_9NOCA|nr:hypothetical protein Rrhod_1966 [Rhodococcus rhodnii LMG 5362]